MENKNDIVILGSYPQSSENISEKEPIEWIMIDQKEDGILCISKYLLDCKPYNETLEKVTWERSTLRKWLNSEFLCSAFTEDEQNRILVTDVKNPLHDTQDRIFLLSYDEAEEYFEFDERRVKTTAYARAQGAWFIAEDEYNSNGSWWLRYPGSLDEEEDYDVLSCVNFDGYIEESAEEVNSDKCSIRPVFWLKL